MPADTPSTAAAQANRLRPEIQGLRAVAVGLVVLYHLWPNRLSGGYIGVDVFFAISGFLITAHLLRELARTGTIRLGAFWARRARRLLPAALLVLLLTAGATVLWVPTMDSGQFFREIGAAGLYVENWVLAADSVNYLAAQNAPSPVQHYWSLSVEEQFYLVWPLLIVLAVGVCALVKRRRAHTDEVGSADRVHRIVVGAALVVVTGASLAASVHITNGNPPQAYFVTPTRAWEFGAGALLAYVQAWPLGGGRAGWHASTRVRSAAAWVGLALIGYSAVTYSGNTPFPGTAAMLPVLGALAVMWAGNVENEWSPTVVLAWRPAQFIGDISYSLYLWHWPLIAIVPYVLGHPSGRLARLSILFASVLLAWASKVWVEDPVRTAHSGALRRTGVTLTATAISMALVAGVSGSAWANVTHRQQAMMDEAVAVAADRPSCLGAPSIDPARTDCPNKEVRSMLVPNPEAAGEDFAEPQCFANHEAVHLKTCTFGPSGGVPRIAVVGDSHARSLLSGLLPLAKQGLLTLDTYLKSGCPLTTTRRDLPPQFTENCVQWNDQLDHVLLHKHYDAVIVMAYRRLKMDVPDGVDAETARVRGFVQAWAPLSKAGIPILAIKDTPTYAKDPNRCLIEHEPDRAAMADCAKPRSVALSHPDPQVAAVKQTKTAHLLDFSDLFCTDTTCPVIIGGVDVYRNKNHITGTYWKTLAPYLRKKLSTFDLIDANG